MKTTEKFEVRTKSSENLTYGVWNKDMCAFQFISEWNSTETFDIDAAYKICEIRNKGILP